MRTQQGGVERLRASVEEDDDVSTAGREAEDDRKARTHKRTPRTKSKATTSQVKTPPPKETPAMNEERRRKLMQLKQSIEDGTYKIDADKLAGKMLREMERDD